MTNKYKFGGKELSSNDFSDGSGLESYDFGARNYDAQIGRWHTIDPLTSKYPSMSPYVFVNNNPINLIDEDGLEPIDPRTGKPISLNLNRAAVYDANYNGYAKLSLVRDNDLYNNANPWLQRNRNKPDGAWDGARYIKHDSNLKSTSSSAKTALSKLFPSNENTGTDYGSPNDEVWRNVAEIGTYTFLDDTYSESEVFFIDQKSFNIMTVEQNYITQIVNLTRSDGEGSFNINTVTTFNIQKGDAKSREVRTWWGGTKKQNYRTLSVTETTQGYKQNQASGNATSKTYTKEEILK